MAKDNLKSRTMTTRSAEASIKERSSFQPARSTTVVTFIQKVMAWEERLMKNLKATILHFMKSRMVKERGAVCMTSGYIRMTVDLLGSRSSMTHH